MDRAACLEYMYSRFLEDQFIFRDVYLSVMHEWEVTPMLVDGKSIGVICTSGHEIHVTLDRDAAKRHAKRIIHACLTERIAKLGHLTTRARIGDAVVAQFLGRLGFYRITEDADCVHYRIDTPKIR